MLLTLRTLLLGRQKQEFHLWINALVAGKLFTASTMLAIVYLKSSVMRLPHKQALYQVSLIFYLLSIVIRATPPVPRSRTKSPIAATVDIR